MYYLYILESLKDGNLYIGITGKVQVRLTQHNEGQVRSTRNRRPLSLVYLKVYSSKQEAAKMEWLIKNTPGAGKLKRRLIEQYKLDNRQ